MAEVSDVFQVYNKNKMVAQVVLNGYDIEAGKLLQQHGAMRSFKIVKGDLWDYWSVQSSLVLRSKTGEETAVKVAALPVDEDSFGLIEFVE